MWELLTRRNPHQFWLQGLSNLLERPAKFADIENAVRAGNRLPLPKQTPAGFAELILECWQPDPASRPDISEVAERLKAMRGDAAPTRVRLLSLSSAVVMFV